MRTLLIGHRGTGKTSLLFRISSYWKKAGRACLALDLDAEISRREGKPVSDVFTSRGEDAFRELERQTLEELVTRATMFHGDVFIALGAGYLGPMPAGWRRLWVRRPSDSAGRVFVDRPRLNSKVSALDEFMERQPTREERYRTNADEVLFLPEGFDFETETERDLLLGRVRNAGGAITFLSPYNGDVEGSAARLSRLGFELIELRDDLLSEETLRRAAAVIGPERILLSLRDPSRKDASIDYGRLATPARIDWPLEWGAPPAGLNPGIVSLHSAGGDCDAVKAALRQLESFAKSGRILKAAVPVEDYEALKEGHRWVSLDPSHRAFLPMSPDGRWSWYRAWMKGKMALNFVRDGDGSAADQPSLFEWLRRDPKRDVFAAVLGDPVSHSRTPAEQGPYFEARGMDVFAIRVTEREWERGALAFLAEIGLRAAAVTAPLKELAFASCAEVSDEAKLLGAVNTLVLKGTSWHGTNTDLGGFRDALAELPEVLAGQSDIAIWGGGGTLKVIETALPIAVAFSARRAQPRDPSRVPPKFSPAVVVWAVGRSRIAKGEVNSPPPEWRPQTVIDMNYAENSPGREYALQTGARYISGLTLFRRQAERQRTFWSENERK